MSSQCCSNESKLSQIHVRIASRLLRMQFISRQCVVTFFMLQVAIVFMMEMKLI